MFSCCVSIMFSNISILIPRLLLVELRCHCHLLKLPTHPRITPIFLFSPYVQLDCPALLFDSFFVLVVVMVQRRRNFCNFESIFKVRCFALGFFSGRNNYLGFRLPYWALTLPIGAADLALDVR